ncbi:MAG: hypothetical protein IT584_00770 [Chlamydiae bacterium]|nr:hypothetical protein [Chlamydiota bacterium]
MTHRPVQKQRISFLIVGYVFFFLCIAIFSFLLKTWDDVRIIPLDFSVFPDKPLVNVTVGSKKASLLLDTGSCECLGLYTSIMNSISDKEFIRESPLLDLKGDSYPTKKFVIPSIHIESHTYEKLLAYEVTPEWAANAGLVCGSFKNQGPIRGNIGRPFLLKWTCLFDCPNRRLLLAPTIDSLAKHIDLQRVTPVPFELHSQGILLSLSTDLGVKRFLLDTGSTGSMMKTSLVKEELMEERGRPLKGYVTSTLSYGKTELGPWSFWLYEICPELVLDGILGIDFFCSYLVLIDFEHSVVYLGKSEAPRIIDIL